MGRALKVQLLHADAEMIPHLRNLGEDVYGLLGEEYTVSINEIDASTKEFHVRDIPKREVRTAAARLRKLAEKYSALIVNIYEVKEGEG